MDTLLRFGTIKGNAPLKLSDDVGVEWGFVPYFAPFDKEGTDFLLKGSMTWLFRLAGGEHVFSTVRAVPDLGYYTGYITIPEYHPWVAKVEEARRIADTASRSINELIGDDTVDSDFISAYIDNCSAYTHVSTFVPHGGVTLVREVPGYVVLGFDTGHGLDRRNEYLSDDVDKDLPEVWPVSRVADEVELWALSALNAFHEDGGEKSE